MTYSVTNKSQIVQRFQNRVLRNMVDLRYREINRNLEQLHNGVNIEAIQYLDNADSMTQENELV